jgi:pimeloyl-ACP methyl ester carboxylesterase
MTSTSRITRSPCILSAALLVAVLGAAGCPLGQGDLPSARELVFPEIPCEDTGDSIYADPGTLPAQGGTIIRCTHDGSLDVGALQARLDEQGFAARPFTTGVRVYRILYRTERGTSTPIPGFSSALVLLPDVARADRVPVVVASHGGRGQASRCAPSLADPAGDYVRGDFENQVYSLAGYGYAVIAPDLAGYADYGAAGNPISGFAMAADVGRSTLDGARALASLIPSAVTDQVVLVGHSQGGHTALSALALADTYGASLNIAAVAVYAPLWLAERTWGGILGVASMYPTATSSSTNSIAIWYHYGRAELTDGAGRGLDLFLPEKRDAIKSFVDQECWGLDGWAMVKALGTDATSYFAPEFIQAVGLTASGVAMACPSDPVLGAVCETWMARYLEDRPHLTGSAARTPIAFLWGGQDTTIAYDRISCALDRLKTDNATLSVVCVEPQADHGGIVKQKADWVADWIAAQTLGEAPPSACTGGEAAIVDPQKRPATCNQVPPND